mmetsp:Transcript_41171/g.94977  ORF Transcript_41171/g.94977 Transcript_41171/m.94977 type:complete len:201 (-) Transcript_41171:301-903(-)
MAVAAAAAAAAKPRPRTCPPYTWWRAPALSWPAWRSRGARGSRTVTAGGGVRLTWRTAIRGSRWAHPTRARPWPWPRPSRSTAMRACLRRQRHREAPLPSPTGQPPRSRWQPARSKTSPLSSCKPSLRATSPPSAASVSRSRRTWRRSTTIPSNPLASTPSKSRASVGTLPRARRRTSWRLCRRCRPRRPRSHRRSRPCR